MHFSGIIKCHQTKDPCLLCESRSHGRSLKDTVCCVRPGDDVFHPLCPEGLCFMVFPGGEGKMEKSHWLVRLCGCTLSEEVSLSASRSVFHYPYPRLCSRLCSSLSLCVLCLSVSPLSVYLIVLLHDHLCQTRLTCSHTGLPPGAFRHAQACKVVANGLQ